jgi:hypothetical protein
MTLAVESLSSVDAPTNTRAVEAINAVAQPILREMPALLEYRAEADPDAEFIPKTVAGFALGTLAMGVCLDLVETYIAQHHGMPAQQLLPGFWQRFAFMIGIAGVSTSLLLVGLKVRAERSAVPLYARHWLNSIGTGALYALLMWGPWILVSHSFAEFAVKKPLAGTAFMALMAFPLIAAKWTIGPHVELPRPASAQ